MRRIRTVECVAAAGVLGVLWWLTDRAPYPYAQRWLLDIPLPLLSPRRLEAILQPRPGERILEIGPGTGLQSLHIAPCLAPAGQLHILDVQQQMLDHVMARAASRAITNITPHHGAAQRLPFDDATFDAAYLVTVLGEIPDRAAVLREIRRVLTPTGRLVIGEFLDRHYLPRATLRRLAHGCGLHPIGTTGAPFSYYAAFAPDDSPVTTA